MKTNNSYESYTDNLRNASNVAEQRRRKLTASCLKTYNYILSALDYLDETEDLESILDEYDIYDPESYDWFNEISDEKANYIYDKYERVFADSHDVGEIIDIIDDVRYLLEKASRKLDWTKEY